MTIINSLFEDQGTLPGTAAGWSFTSNCPTVIVDPAGFCAGPGYPTLDGADTGHTGSNFQMGREDNSDIEYTLNDPFVRTISQTTGIIAEFVNTVDVRYHKKLHADANAGMWVMEIWIAGVLEHTEAVEPGDEETVNVSIDVTSHRGTSVLIEVKLTQSPPTEIGAFAVMGNTDFKSLRVASKSDTDGSAGTVIHNSSQNVAWATAYDKDGELALVATVQNLATSLSYNYFQDMQPHPDGGWIGTGYIDGYLVPTFGGNGATVISPTLQAGTGGGSDTMFIARWDDEGVIDWVRMSTFNPTQNTSSNVQGQSVAIFDDGRTFVAGCCQLHHGGSNGGAANSSYPSFNDDHSVSYPAIPGQGDGFNGQRYFGSFVLEIDPTDGQATQINTSDNTYGFAAGGDPGTAVKSSNIHLVVGHDQTYLLLTGSHTGSDTKGTSPIEFGRTRPSAFTTRKAAWGSITNGLNNNLAMAYLARIDATTFNFERAITFRNGTGVVDSNARGGQISKPTIDSSGNVHFVVESGTLLDAFDVDRDPVPYASIDTLDAGQDKTFLIKMNEAFDKPSTTGVVTEALYSSPRSPHEMIMHSDVTQDGSKAFVSYHHWENGTRTVELFGGAGESFRDGNMAFFKIDVATGLVDWRSDYDISTVSEEVRCMGVHVYEGGPLAGNVAFICETHGSNIQSFGAEDAGGSIEFDVGASWAANGETNGDLAQTVLFVFDAETGAVNVDACQTLAAYNAKEDKIVKKTSFY